MIDIENVTTGTKGTTFAAQDDEKVCRSGCATDGDPKRCKTRCRDDRNAADAVCRVGFDGCVAACAPQPE